MIFLIRKISCRPIYWLIPDFYPPPLLKFLSSIALRPPIGWTLLIDAMDKQKSQINGLVSFVILFVYLFFYCVLVWSMEFDTSKTETRI